MNTIINLFKKEISYYINNSVGYIIISIFVTLTNFFFLKNLFISGSASMRPFFDLLPFTLMFFIPVMGMRTIAEELKSNTIEPLLSLAISETQIVLAKSMAVMAVVLVALLLTLPIPLYLIFMSGLYPLEVVAGYTGIILLSILMTSISIFFSSITSSQVVALLSSVTVLFLVLMLSSINDIFFKELQDFMVIFSPNYYIDLFSKGVLDFRAFIYFLSGASIMLFFTVINLEKRN